MLATLVQWVHVAAAVIGTGGMGFLLLVLMPSLRILSPEQRQLLLKRVLGRFRWVSWAVIVLLIASGLGNIRLWVWDAPWGTYWEWLTLKIILAFFVFSISLALTLPLPLKFLERVRSRRQFWLTTAFVLGLVVIWLSAYLRRA
jgi:uncharacterized membrane protein